MPEICPFLAATHDLDSVLSYPSEGNVCTRLGEAQPVATGHQASYCLRARYWFCPVYNGAIKQPPVPIAFEDLPPAPLSTPPRPLPIPIAANLNVPLANSPVTPITTDTPPETTPEMRTEPRPAMRASRATLIHPREALAALLILAVVGVGGSVLSGHLRDQLAASGGTAAPLVLTATPTSSVTSAAGSMLTGSPSWTPAASATVTLTATLTNSPTITITPTSTGSATMTMTASPTATSTFATPGICVPPADWISYIIQPGETYYHIAAKFGTSVEILQKVNCLADPQRVLSGQTLHVPPVLATLTTTAGTATATAP